MNFFDFKAQLINGEVTSLHHLQGKVTVVVNTASQCGFTPQYEGLEKLYNTYKNQGLEILAFPCNQFGAQEKGSNEEIAQFCRLNYGVSFPVFAKIEVNGKQAHPIFVYLKSKLGGWLGSSIKWNFTKFVLDKNGKPIKRFAPTSTPEEMTPLIEKLLAE